MSERDQLIAMLNRIQAGYTIHEGHDIHMAGTVFIFYTDGQLKEVWSRPEYEGGC